MPSLLALLGLDASSFKAGLENAVKDAEKSGDKITSALGSKLKSGLAGLGSGALGLTLGTKLFEKQMELSADAKEILHGSERLGISISRFQDLKRAAEKSGASIDTVFAAYRKLAQAAVEAEGGDAAMIAHFQTLGISVETLKRSSPDEIFALIAQNASGAEFNVQKLAAIMKTMGKSADELLPGLKKGAFEQANPFKIDEDTIKARAQLKSDIGLFKDAWSKLSDRIFSFSTVNGQSLFGALIKEEADSLRLLLGIKKQTPDGATDLKAVSKADILAEQKAQKDKEEAEKERLKRVARLKEELAEEQDKTELQALSTEEKIVELTKRRAMIIAMMSEMDEENRLKAGIDVEKIKQEIQSIQNKEKPDKVTRVDRSHLNELQRIGAYISNPHADEELRLFRAIDKNTSDAALALKNRGNPTGGATYG